MPAPKAALIEIDGSHDECLYSQLLFLKQGGYETTLICNEKLRSQVMEFDAADEKLFFKLDGQSKWKELKDLWRIRQYLVRNNITTVIFNSAHAHRVEYLTQMLFPRRFRFAGTIHGINKLKGSFTQKMISRKLRKYFVLNDYLLSNLHHLPTKGLAFQSFYPIFFPQFSGKPVIEKPAGEFWIAIPGQVEYKRRDYETLVRAFARLEHKAGYKFLLLGKSEHRHGNGPELRQLIDELGVTAHFIFWKDFLDNATFHAYLEQCDVMMPLIHPGNDGFRKYLTYQITGMYNLAFAYKKPMLMLGDFNKYEDFKENAVFYSLETLPEVLQQAKTKIAAIGPKMYRQPKWSFDWQAKHYLEFIG
jgi:glycosyltransferase involved in cell wall biosynthesis